MVKMTMIEDPESYYRNMALGFRLAQDFNEKEILLKCLSDQQFAEHWKNTPSLRKGYEQGLLAKSKHSVTTGSACSE